MKPFFTHQDRIAGLLAITLFLAIDGATGQTPGSLSGEFSHVRDPYLSELDTILSASQTPLQVHLCFAGAQNLSDAEVAQGALVAQGLALRAGHRPLLLSYGPQLQPEKFNVLIGTVDQLRDFIPDPDGAQITNGYITIQRARGQSNGFYVFVVGRTTADIESTLIDFGLDRKPLPQSSASFISEVILPASAGLTRLFPAGRPVHNLQSVSETFYPFIGRRDGSDFAVLLAERDRETIEAAWTLLGRLAQSANTLFYRTQLSFDNYDSRRQAVVIGTYSHLPPALRKIVALRAFDKGNENIPLAELNIVPSGNNLKHLIERLLGEHQEPAEELTANATVSQLSPQALANRDFGVIAISKLPGTHLLVTAFTPANLLERVQSLVQPPFWDQLRGDIARWKETPASFEAHVPGGDREPSTGLTVELPLSERLDVRIWVLSICATLIGCVIVAAQILGRIDRTPRLRASGQKI
jgi:Bacterial cellulose synthase subunit